MRYLHPVHRRTILTRAFDVFDVAFLSPPAGEGVVCSYVYLPEVYLSLKSTPQPKIKPTKPGLRPPGRGRG